MGTCPVGSFPANGFGLHETTGNVWEWCADGFDPTYYRRSPGSCPPGPESGTARVTRGGSYLCHDSYCWRYRVDSRGANTPDSRFIRMAIDGMTAARAAIDTAIERGEVTADAVFDRDYRRVAGSNPEQFLTRFVDAADAHVRPILDRYSDGDGRLIGAAIVDMNGWLPTHQSAKCHPQRAGDAEWNQANCRNRRIMMDGPTRAALDRDTFSLFTYRQDLGDDAYRAVKSVFVPLHFGGRRWGNFELAYIDAIN